MRKAASRLTSSFGGVKHNLVSGKRQIFGEIGLFAFRKRPGIGNEVIHCCDSRGREITQPTNLHRRWFPREQRQSVVGRMAGKIDQNIDTVFPYVLRSHFV